MGRKRKAPSLIPMGGQYLDKNKNVLLIGLHGCGKTESIRALCAEKGIEKVKYFSCSTLDPYTDLIGVPTPMSYCLTCKDYYHLSTKLCPTCGAHLDEALKMVRPRDVDDAEFIFFDEFSRASKETMNAVFEILQFRSINGETLPDLRCCWAATNPPDHEYHVESIDPALYDRFDAFIEIKPAPSVAYMAAAGIPESIAAALFSWWTEQDRNRRTFESYISPRRLMKIGELYTATNFNAQAVKDALPKSAEAKFDDAKLIDLLEKAVGKKDKDFETIGEAPAEFQYTPGGLLAEKDKMQEYLEDHPSNLETHKRIADTIKSAPFDADVLIKHFAQLMNALNPGILEGVIAGFDKTKKQGMVSAFDDLGDDTLRNLKAALGKK